MPTFSKWIDLFIDGFALLAGAILCAITILLCCDAIGRTASKLFISVSWGYSIPWAIDVAEYGLYLMTFLGAPWVLRQGGHIAIDLLVEQLSPATQMRLTAFTNIMGVLVSTVLFFYSCRVWWTSFRENVLIYETFVFPEWTLLSVSPVTFFLMTIILCRRVHRPTGDCAHNKAKSGL